jgi:16S rRNA (uracil1498-N3)-methyltransferase
MRRGIPRARSPVLCTQLTHRFFAPSLDPGDETVALPREEAEHLTRVLRLTPGDTVAVFDGRGNEFLARVAATERRAVRVQILSRIEPPAEPAVSLVLAQAVLKGEKMDDVVRDAVMLGVAAIHPIVTTRTEVTVAALTRGARLDRWRRIALASVKQSRRATLPEVRSPLGFQDFLEEPAPAARLMLVEPGTSATVEPIGSLRGEPTPPDAAVLVGPEGGWTDEEWTAAREHGVRLVTLGHRTLRADAVSVAVISVLQFLWNDL